MCPKENIPFSWDCRTAASLHAGSTDTAVFPGSLPSYNSNQTSCKVFSQKPRATIVQTREISGTFCVSSGVWQAFCHPPCGRGTVRPPWQGRPREKQAGASGMLSASRSVRRPSRLLRRSSSLSVAGTSGDPVRTALYVLSVEAKGLRAGASAGERDAAGCDRGGGRAAETCCPDEPALPGSLQPPLPRGRAPLGHRQPRPVVAPEAGEGNRSVRVLQCPLLPPASTGKSNQKQSVNSLGFFLFNI